MRSILKMLFASSMIMLLAIGMLNTRVLAASFDGDVGVTVPDPTGALSWQPSTDALSVYCWCKISIPTGTTVANDMTILADRSSGSKDTDPYAYLIQYNATSGNIEFSTRDASGVNTVVLVERPYVDRWYHLAVVRSGSIVYPYVDGELLTATSLTVSDTSNSDGISIGCWEESDFFFGEIQEVAVFQSAISPYTQDLMFLDIDPAWEGFLQLVGYYKLNERQPNVSPYFNAATVNPEGTSPGTKVGTGVITFYDENTSVEQSLFDASKNGGRNALVPLSGAFTWLATPLSRPVTGVPFVFDVSYNSSVAQGNRVTDGMQPTVLSPGWRHAFEMRLQAAPNSHARKILMPGGAVDTWDREGPDYVTRHKEYRGELRKLSNDDYEWETPDHTIFRFYDPVYAGLGQAQRRGRLYQIEDRNGNTLEITWDGFAGIVTQVEDPVGGVYTFTYNAQNKLTEVALGDWKAHFTYSDNRLVTMHTTAPAQYPSIANTYRFTYNADGLLRRIKDPKNQAMVRVVYDNYGRVISKMDALGRDEKTEYGSPGARDITRTDAAGNKWVETHDRNHRMTKQVSPLGHTALFEYDEQGNLIQETDPLGNVTRYEYGAHSHRISSTNALGQIATSVYDLTIDRMTRSTDALGWETHVEYDAKGNPTRSHDTLGTLETRTYYPNGLVHTRTDAMGNTYSSTYTAQGYLESVTDPADNTTTSTYNEMGWVLQTTNALSQTHSTSYDREGNVLTRTNPLGETRTFTYDGNGNLLTEKNPRNHTTTFTYNAANELTQTKDPLNGVSKTFYTALGDVDYTLDALNQKTDYSYDLDGRLISVKDPADNTRTTDYDANGNVIRVTDPLENVITRQYDSLNRVVRIVDPQGNAVQTAYDAVGRPVEIATPLGFAVTNAYDGRGRLTRRTTAEDHTWDYHYDPNGNVVKVVDAKGGEYLMSYGFRNERLLEVNQDGFEWIYEYDELLRPAVQEDPNGTTRTMTYDDAGRITRVDFSTGRVNRLEYDANGNPTTVVRESGGDTVSTSLNYDALDRIASVTGPYGHTVGYTYDALGRRVTLDYPGGTGGKTLTNTWNNLNQLVGQTDWASRSTSYQYDPAGRLVSKTFPNTLTQTNTYDAASRLLSLRHQEAGGTDLVGFEYQYDANGNRTGSKESGLPPMDLLGDFDDILTYTAANRLIDKVDVVNSDKDFTYTYDPSGNMIQAVSADESYTLEYDEDNRVTRIEWDTPQDNVVIQNRYDALGRRVARTRNGVETRFVLDLSGDMELILCDVDDTNAINQWHVHGAGLVYTEDDAGEIVVYHPDSIGNTVVLSDTNAAADTTFAYSPYGKVGGKTGAGETPYKFVGTYGVMEELPGLYFMRARYYLADTGTFLSTDPVSKFSSGLHGNTYSYSFLNPLLYHDPDGKFAFAVSWFKFSVESVDVPYSFLDKFRDDLEDLRCLTKRCGSNAAKEEDLMEEFAASLERDSRATERKSRENYENSYLSEHAHEETIVSYYVVEQNRKAWEGLFGRRDSSGEPRARMEPQPKTEDSVSTAESQVIVSGESSNTSTKRSGASSKNKTVKKQTTLEKYAHTFSGKDNTGYYDQRGRTRDYSRASWMRHVDRHKAARGE
jgi:RHS repeat-associated protein